jgi:hypothetical protein
MMLLLLMLVVVMEPLAAASAEPEEVELLVRARGILTLVRAQLLLATDQAMHKEKQRQSNDTSVIAM